MLRSLLLSSVLLLFTSGFVSSLVIFTRNFAPEGWTIQQRADSCTKLNFFLALKQRNLDELNAKFWLVSDPNSAEYRQFLSSADINDIVAPSANDVIKVKTWLLNNGVSTSEISDFGDALQVHTSVAVIERLFQTELHEFHHSKWQRTIIRQFGTFSLPHNIRSLIDLVVGLTNFPRENTKPVYSKTRHLSDGAEDIGIIPQTTYGLYNVPPPSMQTATNTTSQAAIEIWGSSFNPKDLEQFSKLVDIPIIPLTADHITQYDHVGYSEGTANIQWLSSVNTQATNWFWESDHDGWLYGFTTYFLNATIVPQVLSLGTGWWEGDQCDMAGDECSELGVQDFGYVARMNIEFQKLGLRGVSIIVASGDSGAHTRSDINCLSSSLHSDFPASSPFVTSVGSTQLSTATPLARQPEICTKAKMSCAATGKEVATTFEYTGTSSGGGFSEVAEQPAYQSAAVKQYLTSGVTLPPATYYNASNRAHPDVSAVGAFSLMYLGNTGGVQYEVGTTFSAPIFAAVVSLLNAESIAQSGAPLGFLNPLLYQIAEQQPNAFHDITEGSNICSEHGCLSSCTGFYAAKGWDPVTGLGTPDYAVLLQQIKKLGNGRKNMVETE